ncbi:putative FAD-linked oxidoreductase [bacterium BMS3Bbin14]|nr:putative FAD-linked oxidoreductase [bacterium BMS3Abin13]GBE53298.1 putative FAD-linked oxidoreductase [bacterium BMS3Bbin14]
MVGNMDRKIIKKLQGIVGNERLTTAAEELSCYSYDGTGRIFQPEAVAFPDTTEEIAAILKLANEYRFPVVPRGAGSGMTGGSLPVAGGLVLATSRMNRILEIDPDNMIAVVEPGVINGDLQNALKKHHLIYPPDPASLKFCSIGGNAAECAGGPSAVKYGVTRDYVIGLEVVLPTGEIMTCGVRTEKGVVGYDLTHLFIGSEGTLGIFTKLILRLLPRPEAKATFLITFSSLPDATRFAAKVMAAAIMPSTLEYMDRTAISVVGAAISPPLPENTAALLLLELDGTGAEVAGQKQRLLPFLEQQGIAYRYAVDETERDHLWQARRSISPATFSLRPHKISEDVVVPRSKIPDLVQFTEDLARRLDLTILTFGHAGDGNIHVNIMIDRHNARELENGNAARKQLFEFVIKLGGTLSGEHGIGITKAEFLPLEIGPRALAVMKQIKQLFDPANILNPGKIFPGAF